MNVDDLEEISKRTLDLSKKIAPILDLEIEIVVVLSLSNFLIGHYIDKRYSKEIFLKMMSDIWECNQEKIIEKDEE